MTYTVHACGFEAGNLMMKPNTIKHRSEILLHVSGIPATGKSSFCRYLAREHGFAHYDLECFPRGWPHPELKPLWASAPIEFVLKLRELHENVAIDWGFPVNRNCLTIVNAFRKAGVRLIWFQGNIDHARKLFVEREGIKLEAFEKQVDDIAQARLPTGLEATIVDALTPRGYIRSMRVIHKQIFGTY